MVVFGWTLRGLVSGYDMIRFIQVLRSIIHACYNSYYTIKIITITKLCYKLIKYEEHF